MSYVGYIPLIKQFIHQFPVGYVPSLLEVGIDRGTTMIPLVAYMARTRESFVVVGIDVKVQEQVQLVLGNLDLTPKQQVFNIQANSLAMLPELVAQKRKFDIVLLDGDHNFHTVEKEMALLEDLVYPHSLVVIDDYNGRWSDKDLWYAQREGYEDVKDVTVPVETEKHGVKLAVDEWLLTHPEWQSAQPIPGEPIILMKKAI